MSLIEVYDVNAAIKLLTTYQFYQSNEYCFIIAYESIELRSIVLFGSYD